MMNFFYDAGKLFLRVSFSLMLLPHGWSKINKLFAEDIKFSDPIGIGEVPSLILVAFAEFIAPILIIIGYKTKIAAAALSIFCIATAIIFHSNLSDQMQMIAFMKNIALAGGFLFLVINGAKGFCLDKK